MIYFAITVFLMFLTFVIGLFIGLTTAETEEELDDVRLSNVDEIIRKTV